jgi:hypothetical protein
MPDASQRLVRLIAPKGTDSCSYGENAFQVAPDGTVTVPLEAVDGLTRVGGFTLSPDQPTSASEDVSSTNETPQMENPFDSLGYPDPVE